MADQKRIMVIDDDPDFAKFLILLLEDHGYATIVAKDGEEGIQKTRAERPDLILLDITMPEKSGVKFYREVREAQELKAIPVVMVTGVTIDFKQFIHNRRQVPPPDGYFAKPVDQEELLATISRLLA